MKPTIPPDWSFDAPGIAEDFDAHVREQLPWYDLATDAAAFVARHFIPRDGLVYDIGAATGNMGNALRSTLEARGARLVAIENSPQMASVYTGPGELKVADAADFPFDPFDVAVSMLTLIFMAPADAATTLERLREACRPGGALVLVEKTLSPAGYVGTIFGRLALRAKRLQGASATAVLDKELSLAGVQRPLDPRLLVDHGAVEWFRFGDFAGYVMAKEAR